MRARREHLRITISSHARERCRERFPALKAARMADEARAALTSGRWSPERPPWLAPPTCPLTIYCWTADRERTYALRAESGRWLLVTVMSPSFADAA